MKQLNVNQLDKLHEKLPDWAVKKHPIKSNMSVIHPMAVIDRLNEVFVVGSWNFETDFLSCDKEIQKTKSGERQVYVSSVKGRLIVAEYGIKLEQYGGSTNDDKGDTLKGGATDALTKIASYLGIGAEIYKGKGNINVCDDDKPEPKGDMAKVAYESEHFDL
jgi:hypothetical protein